MKNKEESKSEPHYSTGDDTVIPMKENINIKPEQDVLDELKRIRKRRVIFKRGFNKKFI